LPIYEGLTLCERQQRKDHSAFAIFREFLVNSQQVNKEPSFDFCSELS